MKRREFLKDAALVVAGAAATACGLKDIKTSIAEKKRVRDSLAKSPKPYQPSSSHNLKLTWEPYPLSLVHTFTVSGNSRNTTPDVLVRIEYDDFVGYGEASLPPYLGHTVESTCAFLSKVDLKQFNDPYRMVEILDYVQGLSAGDAPAKAAVDIAMHDLFGKLMGQPVWRIKGLNPEQTPYTSFTIGMDTPEVVAQKTREAAGRFKLLKVKLGGPDDDAMIDAVRSVSKLPIAVDANQGWADKMEALYEIYALKDKGVVMVEQPMRKDRVSDIAWLTERSPLPIFADEAVQNLRDIRACKGVYNGINIKLMKCGGIMEAEKMKAYARESGLKVMIGCMTETSCGISAAAQLSPGADFADLDGNLLISNDPFEGMKIVDGKVKLNNQPGLGLKIKK